MDEFIQRHRNLVRQARHHEQDVYPVDAKSQIRFERINIDKDSDVLSYVPDNLGQVGVYVAAQSLSLDHRYFEIDVLDTGLQGAIAVGLVPLRYPLNAQPGWFKDSVAYHADDGKLYKANGHGKIFGPKCEAGDRMGCGIKFGQISGEDLHHQQSVPVFFTRNGKEIGTVQTPMPADGLFPAIGMHSAGEEIKLHLNALWGPEDDMLMSIDSYEEEWSRLHDVRLNGSILEYAGKGKSIVDIGLAQARCPLDTTCHYFEIEIIDPGENCYIAIGLAHRYYPKHRHPGWNKGSIAYHADDGKIFLGSGVGDPFGPRCHKGDVMGCGIIFPRDYICDSDSDGGGGYDYTPDSQNDPLDELLELDDYHSESEDEEWWKAKDAVESGTKVQVFFTRNGKTIGRKEVRIPRGGFYPTVGMLSSDEKVKVDLRPLSG